MDVAEYKRKQSDQIKLFEKEWSKNNLEQEITQISSSESRL